MPESIVLRNSYDKKQLIDFVNSMQLFKPMRAEFKEHRESRSIDQNSLMHMWFKELSTYLISKGRKTADEVFTKELMKHTFLGYEAKDRTNALTGEVVTVQVLRSTRKLDTGEATYFLDQVNSWAIDVGCLLTIPTTSDYYKNKAKQSC